MTPPLFLVAELTAQVGDTLLLDGDEGRHATRVRRVAVGEAVLISDSRGGVAECEVVEVGAAHAVLKVTSRRFEHRLSPALVLVQAVPKGDRAELAVELATELGVDEIVPWSAARCVVRWDGPRATRAVERWRRAAREASKQSRRAWAPRVADLATTAEVADRLSSAAAGLVLHEDAAEALAGAALPAGDELVLVVGPEGGVAPDELAAFIVAGARAVRLGSPVLRTSTAGAAALAALSVRLGRWS